MLATNYRHSVSISMLSTAYAMSRTRGPSIGPEYLRALQHARPTYFVASTEDLSETAVPNGLQSFPELLTFVMQNYRLEQAFGGVTLYRRRDDVMAGDQPAAGPVGASAAAEER